MSSKTDGSESRCCVEDVLTSPVGRGWAPSAAISPAVSAAWSCWKTEGPFPFFPNGLLPLPPFPPQGWDLPLAADLAMCASTAL